ncbi:unnamed protein product [Caenorhabditis angaria]|uniref:Uncharacterized protein n=1 Tax=Caenorhabditis angaria TaxID=860376 RepID=A0A9P1MXC6_9PELO|nr:unnamed protein product [Caenorhabditis angaria]
MNKTGNNSEVTKQLHTIDEKLDKISAKDVLFIVFISIIAAVSLINLILLILERRKKAHQNAVPQAIVIQPNNSSGTSVDQKSKSEKTKLSNHGEKDVLPSRSMKVKVAIQSGQQSNRKANSKEVLGEDISNVKLAKIENVGAQNLIASKKETDVEVAIPPQPFPQTSTPVKIEQKSETPILTPATPQQQLQPTQNSKANSTIDSMTSFTVPEDGKTCTSQSNNDFIVPGEPGIKPNTPTATTLSGISNEPTSSSKNTAIEPTVVTTPPNATQPTQPTTPVVEKDPKKI